MLKHVLETDSFAFWVHGFSLNFLMDISLNMTCRYMVAVIPRVAKNLTL